MRRKENAMKYQQAKSSATTDYLTGLPNARSLFLHLDSEIARCKRGGVPLHVLRSRFPRSPFREAAREVTLIHTTLVGNDSVFGRDSLPLSELFLDTRGKCCGADRFRHGPIGLEHGRELR